MITRSVACADDRRPGRHAAPPRFRPRPRWVVISLITAAAMVVSALVVASPAARGGLSQLLDRTGWPNQDARQGPDSAAERDQRAGTALAVRSLGVDSGAPAVGQPVTVGVTVAARGSQAIDRVIVAVRDQAGRTVDFPPESAWHLDDEEQSYLATRAFPAAGTYTYWFAYYQNGRWTDLSPKQTFTVVPE